MVLQIMRDHRGYFRGDFNVVFFFGINLDGIGNGEFTVDAETSYVGTFAVVRAVPQPGTLAFLGLGLLGRAAGR